MCYTAQKTSAIKARTCSHSFWLSCFLSRTLHQKGLSSDSFAKVGPQEALHIPMYVIHVYVYMQRPLPEISDYTHGTEAHMKPNPRDPSQTIDTRALAGVKGACLSQRACRRYSASAAESRSALKSCPPGIHSPRRRDFASCACQLLQIHLW